MPKRDDIESVLVIGSGPIVIGQACEFDYSGTQACRVLREEGIRVVLVNSNPATIMTDPEFADATYVEPITPEVVEAIIAKERPDAVLATWAARPSTPRSPCTRPASSRSTAARSSAPTSRRSNSARTARSSRASSSAAGPSRARSSSPLDRRVLAAAEELGYPWSCDRRSPWAGSAPASPTTRSTCADRRRRPPGQPDHRGALEESILGWKEYELEVMRDRADNVVVVCSIENLDPMGVHTGDSITVAP